MKKEPVKVIHFVGNGRSGTTLLNIILDNHPKIMGVGELTYLTRHTWTDGGHCACGQKGDMCAFWSEVKQQWCQRTGISDLQTYVSMQNKFERYRHIPRLVLETIRPSAEFQKFAADTKELYEIIRDIGGVSIVVDSSKHPIRAWALSMVHGIDLSLLFLVRDARGVVWSKKKAFQKNLELGLGWTVNPSPTWKSLIIWQLVNMVSEWVLRKADKSISIRYEDLIATPHQTLARIGGFIGIDLSNVAETFASGQELVVGHVAAGSRLRMNDVVKLRADMDWFRELPLRDRIATWILAGWQMRRYRYKLGNTMGKHV